MFTNINFVNLYGFNFRIDKSKKMKNFVYLLVCFVVSMGCSTAIQKNTIVRLETPLLKSKATGYFKSSGINSDWNLEISEKSIRFQSNEIEMQTPHVEPTRAHDANVKMYRVFLENGEMTIYIHQKGCALKPSAEAFSDEVKITISNEKELKEYVGCGSYIADYRLYNLWALEELEGKKVTVANFTKEIPMLEINASTQSFSGYAGCNRISGTLFQERELLRFTSIVRTKIACSSVNLEQAFLKALQSSTQYEIKDNRLYLSNSTKRKIIFRKVD
jgi:heat shock protein HslJ/uncharacterized membrane protein